MRCALCKQLYTEMGALLFSPPDFDDPNSDWYGVVKHHVCRKCYMELIK